jgi:hypothetical protein
MKTPLLLDVPKTHPTRAEKIKAFKAQHRIWTHDLGYPCGNRWSAMLLNQAFDAVNVYCDTDTRKDLPDDLLAMKMIASACRLLDENGLEHSEATEIDAIRLLCKENGIACEL